MAGVDLSAEREFWDWNIKVQSIKPHNGSREILREAPDFIKDSFPIMMKAVARDGYALTHASPRLKDDITLVCAAVQQEARCIEDAGPNAKNSELVAQIIAANYPFALEHMSEERQGDAVLWLNACSYAPYALRGAPISVLRDERIIAGLLENGYKIIGTDPDDPTVDNIYIVEINEDD